MLGKLTARGVKTAKPGRYGDGGGLWLVVSKTGARKWVFRFTFDRRVTEMGLGGAAVSLAEARLLAADARKDLAGGLNPIRARAEAKRVAAGKPTFGDIADQFLTSQAPGWRNDKHRAQWHMTLERYAGPLRNLPIDQIDTAAVLSVLRPIWLEIPDTASRVRGRIEAVLDSARARGHIGQNEANPARWKGHLETLLTRPRKLARGHHPAMAFDKVPTFFQSLNDCPGSAALALKLVILTACRTGEVLGAEWPEIDLDNHLWTIPATRMKGSREHRVPLSAAAIDLLQSQKLIQRGKFVFAGVRPDKPISNMAMGMLLRRKQLVVTVHGFRSSFRDWCGEKTDFPQEIAEAALAHIVGSATERAYRRGDALEKRRGLMDAWASFLTMHNIVEDVVLSEVSIE